LVFGFLGELRRALRVRQKPGKVSGARDGAIGARNRLEAILIFDALRRSERDSLFRRRHCRAAARDQFCGE
jgi:hypothetical protein